MLAKMSDLGNLRNSRLLYYANMLQYIWIWINAWIDTEVHKYCTMKFRPLGSWINGLCRRFNVFFMLNCDPFRDRGSLYYTTPLATKLWTPVGLWLRVLIPRWTMTPRLHSILYFDPDSWFNVKLWPGIGITINLEFWPRFITPRLNVTRGYDSTNCDPCQGSKLKFDPRSWFNVELWQRVLIPCWIMTRVMIQR